MSKRNSKPDFQERVTYLPETMRLLPQSPDAEQGVLSAFLLAPREVGGMCVERGITSEFFHTPAHGTIYRAMLDMWNQNKPVDVISVTQALTDALAIDSVGGPYFVSQLMTFVPTAANAGYYLDIVCDKALLRRMIVTATEYASRGYDEQETPLELVDEFESKLLSIRGNIGQGRQVDTKELVMQAMESIEAIYERRGAVTGLATGFVELDKMIDGFHPQDMIVIAARPSVGKSALAANIADHIAIELGHPVALFSLEMSSQQLMQRFLCSRARVNLQRVRDGFLRERDFPSLTNAAARIAESRLLIQEYVGLSIQDLKAKARRLKREQNIKLIIVDYLQLLRSNTKRGQENRQQEVSEISCGIKEIARELNIAILVLAQLNRDIQKRGGKPRLSDLRESGSIEQDADIVAFINRDEMNAETQEEKMQLEGKADLIICKQRRGPTGEIPLTFLAEYTRFEDRAREPEPEPNLL
jgi:replicative DNA helicase